MHAQQITLRKFPYPYKAALSICNDIDNTHSSEMFLRMMDYLNSNKLTVFGVGLELEVGNSFWFFNNTGSPQVSYFKRNSTQETAFAPICRNLWQSGHIDILHTYGNFDEGGFSRKYAEIAIDVLQKNNVELKVWINHGNENNTQNIGFLDSYYGAIPEKKQDYHFDLLRKYGIRYAWMGRLTHVLGQDAARTRSIEFKNKLQSLIFSIKYKHLMKHLYDPQNRLLIDTTLQDGANVLEFQRWVNAWGRENRLDSNDLSIQIQPENISTLLRNEGFLLVYTHMHEGITGNETFPQKLKENLKYIAERFHGKELLVATTSRLLKYAELIKAVEYEASQKNGLTEIEIAPSSITRNSKKMLQENDLMGLTFYCENPSNVKLMLNGQVVAAEQNPPDVTGKRSISVPWIPLSYPSL